MNKIQSLINYKVVFLVIVCSDYKKKNNMKQFKNLTNFDKLYFVIVFLMKLYVRRSGRIRRQSHDLVLRYRHLKMGTDYTKDFFFVFKRKIIHFYNISNPKGCPKQHSSLIKSFFVKACIPKVVDFP